MWNYVTTWHNNVRWHSTLCYNTSTLLHDVTKMLQHVTTVYMYSTLCYNIVTTMLQVSMCLLQWCYDDVTTMCICVTTVLQHYPITFSMMLQPCAMLCNNVHTCITIVILHCSIVQRITTMCKCCTTMLSYSYNVTLLQLYYNNITTTLHDCYISY